MRRESDTLRAGDRAPAFSLFDANGRAHTLRELLEAVPAFLLLVFDRGTW
jgi:peroxiredoxin